MTTAQGGGKFVSPAQLPPLPPGNAPGTHFCKRLSRPQGQSAIGMIISMKNSNDIIWNFLMTFIQVVNNYKCGHYNWVSVPML